MRYGLALALVLSAAMSPARADALRPRLRDWGIAIGTLAPGPLDAITDVPGVRVGHVTAIRGTTVNTGVTAILPHERNLFRDKVRAAIVVATDAAVDHRQLDRIARRTLIGLGRAGSAMDHGSGDFVIAFTTSHQPPV